MFSRGGSISNAHFLSNKSTFSLHPLWFVSTPPFSPLNSGGIKIKAPNNSNKKASYPLDS